MGAVFSPPSAQTPPPPPPLPPAAIPPSMANTSVAQAGQRQMSAAKAAAGEGFDNTVKTGSSGVLVPPPTAKSALG